MHKLGLNLAVLNATRESSHDAEFTLIQKLKLVEEDIRERHTVGSLETDARWTDGYVEAKLVRFDEGSIAFVGSLGRTVFSLGGSEAHLVSGAKPKSARAGASYLPEIARWIANLDLNQPQVLLTPSLEQTHRLMSGGLGQGFAGWINVIEQAHKRSTAMPVMMKHFSRRLAEGVDPRTGKRFVLGTPLYIALAEDV